MASFWAGLGIGATLGELRSHARNSGRDPLLLGDEGAIYLRSVRGMTFWVAGATEAHDLGALTDEVVITEISIHAA